jgi:hypothetical protein
MMGDLNHDGRVDSSDATILASYWQQNIGSSSPATVPEPSTRISLALAILTTAIFLWVRFRRIVRGKFEDCKI